MFVPSFGIFLKPKFTGLLEIAKNGFGVVKSYANVKPKEKANRGDWHFLALGGYCIHLVIVTCVVELPLLKSPICFHQYTYISTTSWDYNVLWGKVHWHRKNGLSTSAPPPNNLVSVAVAYATKGTCLAASPIQLCIQNVYLFKTPSSLHRLSLCALFANSHIRSTCKLKCVLCKRLTN